MVGVLEPKDFKRGAFAFYGRSDLARNENGNGEESELEQENEFSEFGFIADPRALPKSIGISFMVDKNSGNEINICATWARYLRTGKIWKRSPKNFVKYNVDTKSPGNLFESDGVRNLSRSMSNTTKRLSCFSISGQLTEFLKDTASRQKIIFSSHN